MRTGRRTDRLDKLYLNGIVRQNTISLYNLFIKYLINSYLMNRLYNKIVVF